MSKRRDPSTAGERAEPSARLIAARVIERVLRDGAYLSRALDAELLRHPQLDARERSLCAELCYGSIRTQQFLREALERHATKKLPSNDPLLFSELLIAAYQVLFLDRVPPSAAVNAAVNQVRKKRGARVAGFANALLRNLVRAGREANKAEAVLASAPAWFRERIQSSLGEAELRALVGATEVPPPIVARLAGAADLPPEWAAAKPCRYAPHAFELSGALTLEQRRRAIWVVQEEGAQLIAWALGARPGETVLDACAGRGTKTSLLWQAMAGQGRLWATDAHPHKLESLRHDFTRLGLPLPELAAVDWTMGQGEVPRVFDRVLVDAPCTGSGTIRRRPEILLRLEPDDPARMGALQESIVRSVAACLVPGGRLLYAVCSVFPEEGEAVMERTRDLFEPVPFDTPVLGGLVPDGACELRLLPDAHGTDGYFMASRRLK